MTYQPREELLQSLNAIREECKRLEEKIDRLVPETEWLTSKQFADMTTLSVKTVPNYCQQKRIVKCRKTETGRWQIHKSELEKFS